MVFVSKLSLAAALAALVGTVASQSSTFQISQPGPNWWWVAESQNVMTWDCKNSPVQQFTVFITNSNPAVLSGRLAFIAQQSNSDCSKLIEKTQINQAPATGYVLQFADVINSSMIYAQSGEFEIKSLGASYPVSSPSSSNPTSSSNSTKPSSTSTSHNSATNVKTSMGLGLAAIGVVLGFMTA